MIQRATDPYAGVGERKQRHHHEGREVMERVLQPKDRRSHAFACVLERFLGLYSSINSFSQLVARTKQGEGYFKKWPPRAGELQVL